MQDRSPEMTHPALLAVAWIAFGAAAIVVAVLAYVGAKSLIKDMTLKRFLGSEATAAVPPWDVSVKEGQLNFVLLLSASSLSISPLCLSLCVSESVGVLVCM